MDLKTYTSEVTSCTALAERLGVPGSLVSQWRHGVRKVPAERCPDIERETGGRVRCEEIRPDVDWACLRGSNNKKFEAQ